MNINNAKYGVNMKTAHHYGTLVLHLIPFIDI